MEASRPKEKPQTVYDELSITLSAIADMRAHEAPGLIGNQMDTMEVEEADPTEPIVGLARAIEEGQEPLSIKAEFVDVAHQEILLQVQRVNSGNGNSYSMSYLASQDGNVYSLIESDGDRGVVQLGQEEVSQILEEVNSCRVTQMS